MTKISSYHSIVVESFRPSSTSGRHGDIHMRPVAGQPLFSQNLFVECSRSLLTNYPVSTKFRIKAILSENKGTQFVYSYYKWPYKVV